MKTKKDSPNKNLIMAIYLYFFMGVGLIMMVIGLYGLGQNYYKSNLFAKYPLGGYEQRCDYLAQPTSLSKSNSGTEMEESQAEADRMQKQKEECEENLEEDRATRKVTDLFNALITFGIGTILFALHLAVNVKVSKR